MQDRVRRALLGIVLAATTSCQAASSDKGASAATASVQQIAWREGDVDDAFVEAKEQNKPVLLYWGAKWCPPCNLMKQTLFKDAGFIAETRNFIPVHLDGDAKGAQLWGEKFGINGYPTIIILRPDRSEVTRLAGGSTAGALAQVLKLTATRTSSTEDLLKRADDPRALSPDDWHLLASFDWLDDPKHFGEPAKGAAFVGRLAVAAPDPAIRRHFTLTSLMMATADQDKPKLSVAQQAQVRSVLPPVLADYAEVKANSEELAYGAAGLIATLPDAAERRALGARLVTGLDRLAGDTAVPLGARLATTFAEITLSKIENHDKVTPAVLAKVRARVAMIERAATDPAMRQAVIPDAGHALAQAGDTAGARKLWEAELPHAVAPYYYMVDLANLAEGAKDNDTAISWLRKAAQSAQGPATRVQWAVMYSQGVLKMTPGDKTAVEQSAGMVIDALGQNAAGYAERTSKRSIEWAKTLHKWSKTHDGDAVLTRLETRMAQACAGGACKNVLKA